jgi:protocatechuate 4,5-dioxygenase beta chain
MAQLIGGLGTSHIPAIGGAIHKGLQQDPTGSPSSTASRPSAWLGEVKAGRGGGVLQRPRPELLPGQDADLRGRRRAASTATPTKAGASRRCRRWPGDLDLSWHLINTLVDKEFDIVTCQEMLVDHACTLPLKLFWPGEGTCR